MNLVDICDVLRIRVTFIVNILLVWYISDVPTLNYLFFYSQSKKNPVGLKKFRRLLGMLIF